MALCVTGLGLLGLTILYVIFSGALVWQYLSGFAGKGFRTCMQSVWLSPPHPLCCRSSSSCVPPPPAGGSSIALFARVAGKCYTLPA